MKDSRAGEPKPANKKHRLTPKVKKKYDPNRVADDGHIYTPYITVKGKVIYHPSGGVFKFLPS